MKRTDSPGLCSPEVRLEQPDAALFSFSHAQQQDLRLVIGVLHPDLVGGIKGRPRHVRNGFPNSVMVGGGTPRNVHSRPNAAMVRG